MKNSKLQRLTVTSAGFYTIAAKSAAKQVFHARHRAGPGSSDMLQLKQEQEQENKFSSSVAEVTSKFKSILNNNLSNISLNQVIFINHL